MIFSWLMKYLNKKKWRTRSNLKRCESEKNIRNYVGKCKSLRKKRRYKALMKEVKTFQLKTTLHLLTLLQFYSGQVRSATTNT